MRSLILAIGVAFLTGAASAALPTESGSPAATAPAARTSSEQPLSSLPYTPGLDPSAMRRDVDPCVDFYEYSCGAWSSHNPIPPDRPSWDVYSKLATQNLQYLWGLLQAAADGGGSRSAAQRQAGDFFAACMDENAIEAHGAAPLHDSLQQIDSLSASRELPALLAKLHANGSSAFFDLSGEQDFNDSNRVIATLTSGGLGLPDRDYYFKTDPKSVETRQQYLRHVERMFELLGNDSAAAQREAATVMRIEAELAKATLTLVEKRDPQKLNHRMAAAGLKRLSPHFSWDDYFKVSANGDARLAPTYAVINATEPAFIRAVDRVAHTTPLADIKTYLRWHLVSDRSRTLPRAFADETFGFYDKFLRGTQSQPPRWKTCVRQVDDDIGDALGQIFVEQTFSAATQQQALDMLRGIQVAMKQRIEAISWMSPATKALALDKLAGIRNKIGYPDRWRDYSALTIARDDYFGNVMRARGFEHARSLAKIGKPVDRDEWQMTPPTVNAYYDPQLNDINFPAAVLQPPLFDTRIDSAPSWGDAGSTMGHELTHGFDDEGRQFDVQGNLRDWWTAADAKEFTRRAQCVVDQYSGYTAIDDIKVNGELTLGENLADLGGTIIAYVGWKAATAQMTLTEADGLTPDQRYFVGMAQWACGAQRPEYTRLLAATDAHSPLRTRVNGVVVNMPEFAKAFACNAGQPMVKEPAQICRVW